MIGAPIQLHFVLFSFAATRRELKISAKCHVNHLLVLFCNHFTISLQGIK